MRVKIFCGALVILMLNVVLLHAQGPPPDCTDPDASCPLDSWIIVLAAGAFVFAIIYLSRKQKNLYTNK
jgi:hypothetical protein